MIDNTKSKLKSIIELSRAELKDSDFGVPELRKYPMPDEKHVRSAIKFFNYVDPQYEEELAKNIKKKMKQYNIDDITVGDNNRFKKYLEEVNLSFAINKIDCILESSKNIFGEYSMASMNPIISTNNNSYITVYTSNNGGLLNTRQYAFSPDIVSSKYLVINENAKLEIVDASYLNNMIVEVYKFIGDSKKTANLYKNLQENNTVDSNFIYTCLSKSDRVLSSDQISFDEDFIKVDLDKFEYESNQIRSLKETFDILQESTDLCNNINNIINELI